MGMDRARGAQREARLGLGARGAQDLREVQHGGEVARLELQRAAQVVQAFIVAPKEVVQHGALVPRLGEVRNASQQQVRRVSAMSKRRAATSPRGEFQGVRGAMVRDGASTRPRSDPRFRWPRRGRSGPGGGTAVQKG